MNLLRALPLVALFVFASPVLAQPNTNGVLGSQDNLIVEPEFPRPGEVVTITLNDYSSQTYSSDLVWQLNGITVADANNQRKVEFVAGALGETVEVTLSMIRDSRTVRSFTTRVVPTYIDIVLEPQTRVPDFYQGRAVPSVGSQVNATVLVNNGRLLDSNLIYTWTLGGKVLTGGPIRGTNRISFDTPRGSQSILSVVVRNLSGNVVARRNIYFQSVRPELVFYESNALHGRSHTAISDTLVLIGNAATVVAEPYYLDTRTYNNPDINEWEIDAVAQTNTSNNPYLITIQKVETGGSAKVSFHVRSTSELLQGVEDSIKVTF